MAEQKNTYGRLVKVASETYLSKLADFLENMEFGSITLVIQDGKIIQIEKNEKVRLK
jgi:hypothetical protein